MSLRDRPLTVLFLLLLPILAATGCRALTSPAEDAIPVVLAKSDVARERSPVVAQADLSSLTTGNTEFAFDLYQALRGESGNLFFSPYSISTALAMVYAGARNETEQQMAHTLHFNLPQARLHPALNVLALKLERPASAGGGEGAFQLNLGNSLWGQRDFEYRTEYLDLIAANYGAGLRLVDFVDERPRELARKAINQWALDQTGGKVEELIQEGILTEFTRLVLANAIYFKGEWESPFLGGTKEAAFTLLDGRQEVVPTMSRRGEAPYTGGSGYVAVEIPYKGEGFAMIVVLPEPGRFEAVESSWGVDLIKEIGQNLAPTDVKLYMPRFEYDASFSLAQTLADLGMPDAFDREKADFTGLIVHPTPRLFLKHVVHQASVAVDEMGTEAAAATAVVAEIVSEPVLVRVDRPFLFFIQDRANETILFMGRVLDPTG